MEITEQREQRILEAKRPIGIGIVINAFLAILKFAAGILGHSYALIADATESASDVLTSSAVFLSIGYGAKPADENHPYGHGKAEPLAGALVSFALFTAAFWIAKESLHLIQTPHPLPAPFTLVVLAVVLAVKEVLFRFVKKTGDHVGSTAVKADAVHQRSDVFVSGAAFIGISIALIGGKGYENADDWAALVASVVIVYGAYGLLSSSISELLDKALPDALRIQICELACEVPEVSGTHKCLVRKVGLDLLVEMDVLVDGAMTVTHSHEIAHAVQAHIQLKMPEVARVLVHIEPKLAHK
jgi:cation diffusion facilitator family transporter